MEHGGSSGSGAVGWDLLLASACSLLVAAYLVGGFLCQDMAEGAEAASTASEAGRTAQASAGGEKNIDTDAVADMNRTAAWYERVLFPGVTCPHCGRRVPTRKGSYVFLLVGFVGQAAFSARFLIQWLASEKAKASVIPVAFWWFSIVGSLLLLAYAVSIVAWPIILGQTPNVFIYSRNLYFIRKKRRKGEEPRAESAGDGV